MGFKQIDRRPFLLFQAYRLCKLEKTMEVICLHDEAFYALIDKVLERVQQKQTVSEDKWISGSEAMQRLRIQSKTTLQKLRDEGSIRFSQPEKKLILYDTDSINAYLNRHAKDTF
ncbi:helix-turn-helix domain-containing protein [Fibrella sp. WM1]|uniref:DNA-binding protein n=1 Tax=Fibrella musci TaxID=3242485 RepID=UPI003521AA52